jgi:hypothetical protein
MKQQGVGMNTHSSRRARFLFLTSVAILSSIFLPVVTAGAQASTLETLTKLREAWIQDLRTKQLEPILKFYAPEAVFLQPTGERITGPAFTARTSKHPAISPTTAATSRKPSPSSPPALRSPPKAATS